MSDTTESPSNVWLIDSFSGDYRFLSNYSNDTVELSSRLYEGSIVYPTAEHAFNALKTTNVDERLHIAALKSPGEAKKYGRRNVTLRPRWDNMWRYLSMESVLRSKFYPGRDITDKLCLTEPATLLEGNIWHDNHWGDCSCDQTRCSSRKGDNVLGIMLMNLRAELVGSTPGIKPLWTSDQ